MNTNWRTNFGGALTVLGTTLMGVGTVSQLNGSSSKLLQYMTIAGFILMALGQFFHSLFAADAKALNNLTDTVADIQYQVKGNTTAIGRSDAQKPAGGILGGTLKLAFLFILPTLFLIGCATTLDTSGVYAQTQPTPMWLYQADNTLLTSRDVLNKFVTWEDQNHAVIVSTWPAMTQAADAIRADAPNWFQQATVFRSNYVAIAKLFTTTPAQAAAASSASNSLAAIVGTIHTAALSSSTYTNFIK